MQILFYLEPVIEQHNPLFRYASLRNHLVPQAKIFNRDNTVLFCSTIIAEKAVADRYADCFSHLAAVDPLVWGGGKQLCKINSPAKTTV